MSLPPYPTGWYAFGLASELRPGAVLSRPFMGEDLVVYRTRSGQVRGRALLRAPRCPSRSRRLVDGELIVCPFHSFAYDPAGVCVRTGYGTKPPARARLAHRPVRELNGLVLAWHGAEEPSWEVPRLEADGWTRVRCRRFVPATIRRKRPRTASTSGTSR